MQISLFPWVKVELLDHREDVCWVLGGFWFGERRVEPGALYMLSVNLELRLSLGFLPFPQPLPHRENSRLTSHHFLSPSFWQHTLECPPRVSVFDHIRAQSQVLADKLSVLT